MSRATRMSPQECGEVDAVRGRQWMEWTVELFAVFQLPTLSTIVLSSSLLTLSLSSHPPPTPLVPRHTPLLTLYPPCPCLPLAPELRSPTGMQRWDRVDPALRARASPYSPPPSLPTAPSSPSSRSVFLNLTAKDLHCYLVRSASDPVICSTCTAS